MLTISYVIAHMWGLMCAATNTLRRLSISERESGNGVTVTARPISEPEYSFTLFDLIYSFTVLSFINFNADQVYFFKVYFI